ncbi:histidine phosphatase family protein [Rhodococcus sp. X156]|uniref:histidine phosphatase family protein n=1 Tax=Rhodococcus sp. X156 TaxID=2499145 RepID=UPI001F49E50E|nr:histidine phosphatase family protein [Rhodococcus sp. X156]
MSGRPLIKRRLILLRHGETSYNATSRMQGQLDTELNPLGVRQAAAAAQVLAERKPGLVISSDLTRAADTARHLVELVDVPLRHDPRLRETFLGEWQGLTHSEVEQGWPGGLGHWRTDVRYVPPGGESKEQVAARSVAVVQEIEPSTWDAHPVVLVAHGGLILALAAALLGLPRDSWSTLGSLGNARWAELSTRADGQWRLDAWNAGVV